MSNFSARSWREQNQRQIINFQLYDVNDDNDDDDNDDDDGDDDDDDDVRFVLCQHT